MTKKILLALFISSVAWASYYGLKDNGNILLPDWNLPEFEEPNEPVVGTPITYDIYVDGQLGSDAVGTYSVANRDTSGSEIGYKTIASAVAAVSAGETIGIREGTYTPSSTANLSSISGTDVNNPITIRAYAETDVDANETVVVNGSGFSGDIFNVSNTDYVYFIGFEICYSTGYCVDFTASSDYGQCYYMTMHDSSDNCVRINDSNYATIHYSTFYDSNSSAVIFRGASYCTADRNECYQNREGVTALWHDTTVDVLSYYNTISNNLCYNNTNDPEGNDGLGSSNGCRYTTVVNNICFNNYDDGIDCSLGGSAGGDIINGYRAGANMWNYIVGNICFNSGDGGGLGDGNGLKCSTNGGGGNLVAYNICFDNEKAGYDQDKTDGYPSNLYYNNIAYNNGTHGFAIDHPGCPAGEGAVLYNNTSIDNAGNDLNNYTNEPNAIEDANNNFWADGLFADGLDGESLSGDPNFLDPTAEISTTFTAGWTIDQKLAYIRDQVTAKLGLDTMSTAIDAGREIAEFHAAVGVANDYGNIWYGVKPDIGALESNY